MLLREGKLDLNPLGPAWRRWTSNTPAPGCGFLRNYTLGCKVEVVFWQARVRSVLGGP